MMTGEQYTESLRKLNLVVYLLGERVINVVDHPMIRPSLNAVAITYDLAHRPEYMALMTAISPITGRRINRFTHIHQSTDDLIAKSKMGRLLGSLTGCCFQRCVGMDALNAPGAAAVGYLAESMHGAGSPQAQRVMIAREVDMKGKQAVAKRLCGIPDE